MAVLVVVLTSALAVLALVCVAALAVCVAALEVLAAPQAAAFLLVAGPAMVRGTCLVVAGALLPRQLDPRWPLARQER